MAEKNDQDQIQLLLTELEKKTVELPKYLIKDSRKAQRDIKERIKTIKLLIETYELEYFDEESNGHKGTINKFQADLSHLNSQVRSILKDHTRKEKKQEEHEKKAKNKNNVKNLDSITHLFSNPIQKCS